MSAPAQTASEVAERLEAKAEQHRFAASQSSLGDGSPYNDAAELFEAAASLIRAQSERERVLVAAASKLMTLVEPMVRGNTDFSVTWRKYVREMRAALTKAQP